ncbi:Fe-S-containing hydro-lyase [Neobacillus niacini]|uniref:Fe-S-containing hydro-lyase n=1 Tax=Neobacillus niacini TaxID=86668 RepID=UPI0020411C53|nr:Fe-S-containing hydro-lyase [Neobacillus niacini]MCM3691187.1 Fe-S-containing hydro-lyase [Neobacillus niacini]
MSIKKIKLPFEDGIIETLKAGDRLLLTGTVFTARDAAHKRMFDTLEHGKTLPINVEGQVIYYVGPTPAMPGKVIGSAGPTTSGRMDKYTPRLLDLGLKGMIGKGYRSEAVIQSIIKNKAVYLGAIGGSAALLSKTIKSVEVVAYEDLGTEAIRKMEIVDFPVIVINDSDGNDLYKQGNEFTNKT